MNEGWMWSSPFLLSSFLGHHRNDKRGLILVYSSFGQTPPQCFLEDRLDALRREQLRIISAVLFIACCRQPILLSLWSSWLHVIAFALRRGVRKHNLPASQKDSCHSAQPRPQHSATEVSGRMNEPIPTTYLSILKRENSSASSFLWWLFWETKIPQRHF